MKKTTVYITALLIIAASAYYLAFVTNQGQPEKARLMCFNGKDCVRLEVADTPDKRAEGLMHRKKIDSDYGMLFVFPEEGLQSFWMKNTLIPLDIIWINSSMHVVHIEHAVPCRADPCRVYSPLQKARYVLEVNANYTLHKRIGIGDLAEEKEATSPTPPLQ